MMLTNDNLSSVIFENEDARLLILDVILHTQANLYYYHDVEITVSNALDIWRKSRKAEEQNAVYSTSFLPSNPLWPVPLRRLVGTAS